MELKEIKNNIIDKLPKIMEYSIGNFGQLSSIEKLIDIHDILHRIKRYWDNGFLFSDNKNEFVQFGGEASEFDNLLFEVNILNNDITELFNTVEQVFLPTLEIRIIQKALETIDNKKYVVTELPNIVKIDSEGW